MQIKRAIKHILGTVCESPMLRTYVRRHALECSTIVYYHYVGLPRPHYSEFDCGCTAAKFTRDLLCLSRVFDFAPLADVLSNKSPAPVGRRPTLSVTFDDGFDLLNTGVMEILDHFGVKATTFLITSTIGNQVMMWRHMLSAIKNLVPERIWRVEYNKLALNLGLRALPLDQDLMYETSQWDMVRKDEWASRLWARCNLPPVQEYLLSNKPYFDWNGLHQWISAGHSVGFHTHTHPYCSRLSADDLEAEIIQPALHLKERLKIREVSLSYPFGSRLPVGLEDEMFGKGIFNACLGISGLNRIGVSNQKMERIALEGSRVGWAVFRPHILHRIKNNENNANPIG
jgi:peptidoglycan/xylan/chitin deacetylase (PgdA/CDA1 family)